MIFKFYFLLFRLGGALTEVHQGNYFLAWILWCHKLIGIHNLETHQMGPSHLLLSFLSKVFLYNAYRHSSATISWFVARTACFTIISPRWSDPCSKHQLNSKSNWLKQRCTKKEIRLKRYPTCRSPDQYSIAMTSCISSKNLDPFGIVSIYCN